MYFQVVLPCELRKRASFDGATGVRHQQLRGRPALLGGATRVGNFDERQWGNLASAVTVVRIADEFLMEVGMSPLHLWKVDLNV
jgi:hypothetical protein